MKAVSDHHRCEIRAYRDPLYQDQPIAIYIRKQDYEDLPAQAVTFDAAQYVAQGAAWPCAARLSLEESQLLMDSLWQAGLRPAEGSGSTGQLAATVRHLEDMRAIAFEKTGVLKP